MSRGALDAWRDRLAERKTNALLVIRHDKIVYEWYANGHGPEKKEGTASLAKAIVGGSSLMVALQDGRIKPDDLAAKYIPAWRGDSTKNRITIRQLATHTSGIEDAEQDDIDHMRLPGWKGAFWKRMPDPFSVAIHQAPVIFAPGSSFEYSNPGMAALAYAVTASLQGAPETNIRAALKARILDPLGVPETEWSIGYGRAYTVDGLELYANWGGGAFSPRATARIGQLMLHGGEWEGKRLFDKLLVEQMISYAGMPIRKRTPAEPAPGSGLCWWLNFDGVWPNVPRDAFVGAGANQELLLVVPSLDLIVVRNGGSLALQPSGAWSTQSRNRQAPAQALPGDYLQEQSFGDGGALHIACAFVNSPDFRVSVQLFDRIIFGKSNASKNLDGFGCHILRDGGAEIFRHRGLRNEGLARIAQTGGVINHETGRFHLRSHLGKLELHALKIANAFAELFTLARML
jgi:CubicO group peptidase (beta-lactamase class C family)